MNLPRLGLRRKKFGLAAPGPLLLIAPCITVYNLTSRLARIVSLRLRDRFEDRQRRILADAVTRTSPTVSTARREISQPAPVPTTHS